MIEYVEESGNYVEVFKPAAPWKTWFRLAKT